MASNTSTRRGILGAMAALAATPAIAMPAIPALPSFTHLMAGGSWAGRVAEYHAAKQALQEAKGRHSAATAKCKQARGRLLIPAGIRSPLLLGEWLKMSADEIRADLMVRRGSPTTQRGLAFVEQDMQGVPEFKAEYDRLREPIDAAWLVLEDASDRFYEAEQQLHDFAVANIVELAEKLAIARADKSEWIMRGVEADTRRLGGLS